MSINLIFHQINKFLLAGWTVLVGAIVLNGVAIWLGLPSWYDVLSGSRLAIISRLGFVWLLIGYPLGLGGLVWVANRVVSWYNYRFVTRK